MYKAIRLNVIEQRVTGGCSCTRMLDIGVVHLGGSSGKSVTLRLTNLVVSKPPVSRSCY